jgi:hypothetical protein
MPKTNLKSVDLQRAGGLEGGWQQEDNSTWKSVDGGYGAEE